jgi:hypothetical protein
MVIVDQLFLQSIFFLCIILWLSKCLELSVVGGEMIGDWWTGKNLKGSSGVDQSK